MTIILCLNCGIKADARHFWKHRRMGWMCRQCYPPPKVPVR